MDNIFISYALNSSAYSFLVYKPEIFDIHVNMIIEFRDAVFFEDNFSYKRETDKTLGKELMRWRSGTKIPRNRLLMQKLN